MTVGIMSCFEEYVSSGYKNFPFTSGQSILEYNCVIWDMYCLGYDSHFTHDVKSLRRFLKHRTRRLNEIEIFLSRNRYLFILCPPPDELDKKLQDILYSTEMLEILKGENLEIDSFDIFSFLPPILETTIRDNAVKGFSTKMDFQGDQALIDGWLHLKSVDAAYKMYLLSSVGTPFLFAKNTRYVVGTIINYKMGKVVLIPGTYYDTGDDYPSFVKAAESFMDGIENPTGKKITIEWENDAALTNYASKLFVDLTRIRALRKIKSQRYDLTKLISLCEEVNLAYENKCYYSTIMLVRSILDHVPPIFGVQSFSEVANNYNGGRSFKEIMGRLDSTSRKIADMHLHTQIRRHEPIPNRIQVDFSNEVDVLLSEVQAVLTEYEEVDDQSNLE